MKIVKMSLVAVMALGSSAFAIENVKANGDAKLWYNTTEYSGTGATAAEKSKDFFAKDTNTMANFKVSVGATADLLQSLSAGVKMTALSTLGVENNLVGEVPTNKFNMAGSVGADKLNDQSWVEEAYLAYTAGKTTAKVGRQALNTPLAFTEDWNIVSNTFEAAVLLNNDLPDTTLVGAWIGKHNSVGMFSPGRASVVAYEGAFNTFGTDGAYAAGAINKSLPNTTAQAWYYDVVQVAQAYWLQADAKVIDTVNVGVQYAGMSPEGGKDTNVLAVKAATDVSGVNVYAAYSTVSKGTLGFANVATGDKSSVYTTLGSIYMDGEMAAAPDTDAWKIGASTKMIPGVTLSASYAAADQKTTGVDYSAWDIIAKTKVGIVDLTAYYTQFDKDVKGTTAGDKTSDTVRIVAAVKF